MSATAPFVITRTVPAPRARVWQAWTEVEHLRHWWGPKGFVVAHCTVDLRPGGLMHYRLRSPEGGDMWGRFLYREIVKPEKLVWVNSFSDEKGGITRHPMAPGWPAEMLTTVTFADGMTADARLSDISRSGAALVADRSATPGDAVAIGRVPAHVVRVFDGGFAVVFDEALGAADADRLVAGYEVVLTPKREAM